MSDTVQLAIVLGVVAGAAVYLIQRWRRPKRVCDACPVDEPTEAPLLQLGRKGRPPPRT